MAFVASYDHQKPREPAYKYSQQYAQRVHDLPHGSPNIQPGSLVARQKHGQQYETEQDENGDQFFIEILADLFLFIFYHSHGFGQNR